MYVGKARHSRHVHDDIDCGGDIDFPRVIDKEDKDNPCPITLQPKMGVTA